MNTKINIDFSTPTGKFKAMHAVGQPPFPHMSPDYMHYLTDAPFPFRDFTM